MSGADFSRGAAWEGLFADLERARDRAEFQDRLERAKKEAWRLWRQAEANGRLQRETALRLATARAELRAFAIALREVAPEHSLNTKEGRAVLRRWAAEKSVLEVKQALGLLNPDPEQGPDRQGIGG